MTDLIVVSNSVSVLLRYVVRCVVIVVTHRLEKKTLLSVNIHFLINLPHLTELAMLY